MELIDISVPIRTGMVTYPGDPGVEVERVVALADGAPFNLSKIEMDSTRAPTSMRPSTSSRAAGCRRRSARGARRALRGGRGP